MGITSRYEVILSGAFCVSAGKSDAKVNTGLPGGATKACIAYGDLNEYLKSRIEAEVRSQKMGVGTLTLGA